MKFCDYGCGKKAKYSPGKGRLKWCCSRSPNSCPENKRKNRESHLREKNHMFRISKEKHPMFGKKHSKESIEKNRKSQKGRTWKIIHGEEKTKKLKARWRKEKRLTIKQIKDRYAFFSQIEDTRYNPHKLTEIQVHCKNYKCKNSKEKGGWFTPSGIQFSERVRALENKGRDLSYFYCSEECKNICPLYYSRGNDPFKETEKPYTKSEYQTFRIYVLERDSYICQFCGESATDVHHEKPQKLEPFFALDPYYAWSCCEKCHYEKGHKDDCSTGRLAYIVC